MSTAQDELRFWSKSPHVAPGRGSGERVAYPAVYTRLAAHRDWRKVLSNFHVCPFRYNGRTYRTIEHAFQAAKIALVDPGAAYTFTVESGTDLGARGDGKDAQAKRKLVRLPPAKIAVWDAISGYTMEHLAELKYRQCAEARRVLLDTLNAQLWHIVNRKPAVRFVHLERLRSRLRQESF